MDDGDTGVTVMPLVKVVWGEISVPVVEGDTLVMPRWKPFSCYPRQQGVYPSPPPSDVDVIIWVTFVPDNRKGHDTIGAWHFHSYKDKWVPVSWEHLDSGQQYTAVKWYRENFCISVKDRTVMVHDVVPWEKGDPLVEAMVTLATLDGL